MNVISRDTLGVISAHGNNYSSSETCETSQSALSLFTIVWLRWGYGGSSKSYYIGPRCAPRFLIPFSLTVRAGAQPRRASKSSLRPRNAPRVSAGVSTLVSEGIGIGIIALATFIIERMLLDGPDEPPSAPASPRSRHRHNACLHLRGQRLALLLPLRLPHRPSRRSGPARTTTSATAHCIETVSAPRAGLTPAGACCAISAISRTSQQ